MDTIFIGAIGSIHARTRLSLRRYGFSKGKMCYMLHVGKRSYYFYPVWCSRQFKKHNVFA